MHVPGLTEQELLEKYEPVLRFARSERFFPMAIEPYLEKCSIFPSGPQGVIGLLSHPNEPLPRRIGKLPGDQYFLRFVNNPLTDSDAWIWWGIFSVIGISVSWLYAGRQGAEIAFLAALIAALAIFTLASPIRVRIIPAIFAVLFFISLEVAPLWFFLRPSPYLSVEVEYFVLFPIYLAVLIYFSVLVLKFILDQIVPEGPGLILDMFSQATEKIAVEAYSQYAKILEAEPAPIYYGRVVQEKDSQGNDWKILQYNFFYAFNDWRFAANGMNHHEGDWEMVAVYLKNDSPYIVAFSQHGSGNIEMWDMVYKAVDKDGSITTHPIVYVALGSHANYSRPEVIRSPKLYKAGTFQRFLYWTDGLIHFIFMLFNPNQKARQIALKELAAQGKNFLSEDSLLHMRDEEDHYVVSLPLEIASGDGFRIGFQGDYLREPLVRSSSYLKRTRSHRETTHPGIKTWQKVLLYPEPDWVQYKGLWGVKSYLTEESGPSGPKWDRPQKGQSLVRERPRWSRPLDWLAELEANGQK